MSCTIQWKVCHELGEKIRAPLREEGPEDLGCAVREERVDPKEQVGDLAREERTAATTTRRMETSGLISLGGAWLRCKVRGVPRAVVRVFRVSASI